MAKRYSFVAALLLLLSLLGFTAGPTVFGVLEITPALNSLHLLAAVVAALAAMRGLGTMRAWGQVLGYAFAILATLAFATDAAFVGGLLPLTNSNAWLHLGVSLFFLYHALLAPPTL